MSPANVHHQTDDALSVLSCLADFHCLEVFIKAILLYFYYHRNLQNKETKTQKQQKQNSIYQL